MQSSPQSSPGGPGASPHAITDLYDEQRRTFLVQYPIWFIIALGLTGVAAFAVTGFLGYSKSSLVYRPWDLYLWFCALLVTLQVSIFRNVALRRRLVTALFVSLLCIVIVYLIGFPGGIIRSVIERLLPFIGSTPWTYTVINFGLLAIFWVDTVRRWIRRMRGLPPNPRVYLGIESDERMTDPDDLPSLQELVSGDLIAGAVLALLLALLFRQDVVSFVVHSRHVSIALCTVSWPVGHCAAGGTLADPPTLTFMDLVQALIYLPVGLLVLALSATLSGLGALNAVPEKELQEPKEVQASSADETATVPIAEDVTTTVLNTLRSALDRRLKLLLNNLVLSLRNVAWPPMIFVATYGVYQLSLYIQLYLHSAKGISDFSVDVLPAVAWGLAAVFGVVFSAALTLFRWRVAENSLRFIGLIGFVVLLTFWIFSLALWGFNQLLLQTHASTRHPFDPPSWSTVVSLAALLIFAAVVLVRRGRAGSRKPAFVVARAEAPVGVPARAGQNNAPQASEPLGEG